MANKGYNEVVATCKLVNYEQMFTSADSLWIETWEDELYIYKALFSPASDSLLPTTYFKMDKINDHS